jgi:hypothetical protein
MYIHPSQNEDVRHDKNIERQNEMLNRLDQYQILQSPPIPTESELTCIKWSNTTQNNKIDNKLLFALYQDAVNLFVTNDKDIIKKANKTAGLRDRVYNIKVFLQFLKSDIPPSFDVPQAVNNFFLHNCDIDNTFFSLRRTSKQ